MNRLIGLAILAVAVIYLVTSSLFVINEREQAIVMRFGEITQVYRDPGIHWKLPTSLVDTVQIIDDRLLRYDKANMRLQVADGKQYIVDAFLTYRITNPQLFRERAQGDLRVVEMRIDTRLDSALRQVYGLRAFTSALSAERQQMMTEARDLIRPDMGQLGVDIVDVRILRTDLTAEVSDQTYARMKAERLAEAAALRARGNEAAQSIRAIAQRQAIEIVATATRDASIVRGQGDAQRNAIFASAYNRDAEFFEFYRAMQAYQESLASAGTTMVLSPDSEFFRYFKTDGIPSSPVQARPGLSPAISSWLPPAPAAQP